MIDYCHSIIIDGNLSSVLLHMTHGNTGLNFDRKCVRYRPLMSKGTRKSTLYCQKRKLD